MSHPLMKYLREDWMPTVLCAGCGDGTVLQCMLQAVENKNIDIDQVAIVAGIGCHARLGTGYIASDSMWPLHGRALQSRPG